jgi:hypothetical protein
VVSALEIGYLDFGQDTGYSDFGQDTALGIGYSDIGQDRTGHKSFQ